MSTIATKSYAVFCRLRRLDPLKPSSRQAYEHYLDNLELANMTFHPELWRESQQIAAQWLARVRGG